MNFSKYLSGCQVSVYIPHALGRLSIRLIDHCADIGQNDLQKHDCDGLQMCQCLSLDGMDEC